MLQAYFECPVMQWGGRAIGMYLRVHVIRWSVNDTDGREQTAEGRTVLTEEPMATLKAGEEGGRWWVGYARALPGRTRCKQHACSGPLLPWLVLSSLTSFLQDATLPGLL